MFTRPLGPVEDDEDLLPPPHPTASRAETIPMTIAAIPRRFIAYLQ
jgi:hypothetical protein